MDHSIYERVARLVPSSRPRLARLAACTGASALLACTFTASTGSGRRASYPAAGPATHDNAYQPPPAVMRYYSPPLYQRFVSRSVPYHDIAERSHAASVDAVLRVREADAFRDDYYTRKGKIVLLGVEAGTLVGFTTRYSVDIQYPDDDLIRDGVGKPDFRESTLTLAIPRERCLRRKGNACSLRYRLERAPADRTVTPRAGNRAYYRTFGDNDAVLVYFPRSAETRLRQVQVQPMGLLEPTRAVADAIRGSNRLMGQEFVLVSPTSLKLLRKRAGSASVLATYGPEVLSWAAGLVGAHTVVKALVKRGFEYILMDRQRIEKALATRGQSTYVAQELVRDFDFAATIHDDGRGRIRLPALSLVELPPGTGRHAAEYLRQVAGDASVELILFGSARQYAQNGMLYVPAHHLNLNYELVRAGLARLRLDRRELALFPEFAEAAHEALADGAGFAAEWRDDRAYVAAVAEARARR